MRYSTQTLALSQSFGLKSAVEAILDAGFPAIDMTMSYGEERWALGDGCVALAKELKKVAADRGAVFNQAHAPFGGGNEYYLSTTVPALPRIFEFAGLLGAECIVVHPMVFHPHRLRAEECFYKNMELYTRLAPYAKDAGIRIAIENMWERDNATGKIIAATCDDPYEHARYFDALSDPEAFTLCLDVGHAALTGGAPDESVRILGKRLGALHIHDVDLVNDSHTMPGLGKVNWRAVTRALGESDYNGYLTLECDKGYLSDLTCENAQLKLKELRECAESLAKEVDSHRKI